MGVTAVAPLFHGLPKGLHSLPVFCDHGLALLVVGPAEFIAQLIVAFITVPVHFGTGEVIHIDEGRAGAEALGLVEHIHHTQVGIDIIVRLGGGSGGEGEDHILEVLPVIPHRQVLCHRCPAQERFPAGRVMHGVEKGIQIVGTDGGILDDEIIPADDALVHGDVLVTLLAHGSLEGGVVGKGDHVNFPFGGIFTAPGLHLIGDHIVKAHAHTAAGVFLHGGLTQITLAEIPGVAHAQHEKHLVVLGNDVVVDEVIHKQLVEAALAFGQHAAAEADLRMAAGRLRVPVFRLDIEPIGVLVPVLFVVQDLQSVGHIVERRPGSALAVLGFPAAELAVDAQAEAVGAVVGGVVAEGIAAKEGGNILDVQLQIFGLLGHGVFVLGIVAVAHNILAEAIHTEAGAGVAHTFNNIGAAQGFDDKAIELKLLLGQLCI